MIVTLSSFFVNLKRFNAENVLNVIINFVFTVGKNDNQLKYGHGEHSSLEF